MRNLAWRPIPAAVALLGLLSAPALVVQADSPEERGPAAVAPAPAAPPGAGEAAAPAAAAAPRPDDPAAAGTPNTYFIDRSDTFTHLGDWTWQEFVVGGTTTFVLRFASSYSADAAIFAPDQLSAFTNNQGFTGWAVFDNQTGYKTVTLGPGTYYVGARNQTNSANPIRLELDYQLTLPGYQQQGTFGKAENVPDGSTYWLTFTIQSGRRYFIDGVNSGLEVWTVPAADHQNFLNDQAFNYYPAFSGTDTNLPGLWELNLAPGSYTMFFRNRTGQHHTVNYLLEWWGWPPLPAPSGLTASAQKKKKIRVSWFDNSSNESGFTIQRGLSPDTLADYVDVGPGVRSYTFGGLTKGQTYYFRVYAWNAQQNSAYSGIASATARK
jgi:hypothetical protein